MSVATEITRLQNAKSALKTAINAKNDAQHQIDDETLDDYATFVNDITTGIDISDTTATASDVLSGKDFYLANGTKTTGTIQTYSGNSTITSNGTISTNGKYMNTDLTVSVVPVSKLPSLIDRSITSIDAGDFGNITEIGSNCFRECSRLNTVVMPNTITTIRSNAFYSCAGITSLTFSQSLTTIESGAFNQNSGLTSITFPNSLTTLGNNCFYYCNGLTTVTIGTGITSIGSYAFGDCRNLTSMTILATNPPTLINVNAISNTVTTIYVPAGRKTAYETASNWVSLTTRTPNPVTFVELS